MSMHASEQVSDRGTGGALFASILMIIGGVMGAFQGIAGITKSTFFVVPADYWITVNTTAWGWTHLVVGLVLVAAGFGVMTGDRRGLGRGELPVHPDPAVHLTRPDRHQRLDHPLPGCAQARATDDLPQPWHHHGQRAVAPDHEQRQLGPVLAAGRSSRNSSCDPHEFTVEPLLPTNGRRHGPWG